jgi:hypothetical protein
MSPQALRTFGTRTEINCLCRSDLVVGPIRDLSDVSAKGGSIHATCRDCGRVAIFSPREVLTYLTAKRLDTTWPNFARYLVCARPVGCGAKNPQVSWSPTDPPPSTPIPPQARFSRQGDGPKVPEPISMSAFREKRRRAG